MFKIHENGDGTTSIFCSKTGNFICNIKSSQQKSPRSQQNLSQQKNMGLGCRPVNVVESSPNSKSCCISLDLKNDYSSEDEKNPNSSFENCVLSAWNEVKEDFSADEITGDDFARCLNLAPKEKFKDESIDNLRSTFPLRQISRLKPLLSDGAQHLKFPEDLPVTSSLGLKILNLMQQKSYYSDQTVQMKIKSYDLFCRCQIELSDELVQFPKLRCRERKDYGTNTPLKILNSRYAPAHTYAFNKRQREENLITFKTGLNARSRKLLITKCNKRLAVSVDKLPEAEAKYWMQKRAKYGPVDFFKKGDSPSVGSDSDATVIDQNPKYIDLVSDDSSDSSDSDSDDPSVKYRIRKEENRQHVWNNCKDGASTLRSRNEHHLKLPRNFEMHNCSIVLRNVLFSSLLKYGADYYVIGTNIRVPFLQSYINNLDPKVRCNLRIPETSLLSNTRYDHAYHLPFTQDNSKKKLLSPSHCLKNRVSKIKSFFQRKKSNDVRNKSKLPVALNNLKGSNSVKPKSKLPVALNNLKGSDSVKPKSKLPAALNNLKGSDSVKSFTNSSICEVKLIPVIDLTDSPPKENKKSPYWIFRCYGCGYNESANGEAGAYTIATKHMKSFHCVSDVKSFLNVCNTSSCVTLEAFPGYKSSPVKKCT